MNIMSNKVLFKSGFLVFRIVFIMALLLPGLVGFVNDYILFFIIYTAIWYFIAAIRLTQVDLLTDTILIKYPLCFWKKDKKINYSNVIEFKHYSIPRGQDLLEAKYNDINSKLKKNRFPCDRRKANMLMKEIKKRHRNVKYKTYDSFLHSMKESEKNISEIEQQIKQIFFEETGNKISEIRPDNNISEYCNELDIIGIIMELEIQFKIEIPDDIVPSLETINKLTQYVAQQKGIPC